MSKQLLCEICGEDCRIILIAHDVEGEISVTTHLCETCIDFLEKGLDELEELRGREK